MLSLAMPVVAAEVGWVTMQIVDIGMVGQLGPEAIGAVGVGSALFLTLAVVGIGFLLGLDPLIAQAFGAQRFTECRSLGPTRDSSRCCIDLSADLARVDPPATRVYVGLRFGRGGPHTRLPESCHLESLAFVDFYGVTSIPAVGWHGEADYVHSAHREHC